jgi:Tfp pilus assembly protein PilO
MNALTENRNPRLTLLLLAVVLILVALAQGIYLLWPQYKQWQEQKNSEELLQRATRNNGNLEQQILQQRQHIDALNQQLYGELAGLPEEQIESFLVGRLQNISWSTGVELISVVPGSGKSIQNFRETLFHVRLQARYRDFFAWLQQVREDLGYSIIQRFELSPLPGQTSPEELADPLLRINLTIVIYRIDRNEED